VNYTEDDLIPISALQHLMFCKRQCALIHIEQLWDENLLTAEGRIMHERVHEADRESRGDVRIERGVPLRAMKLGLIGKADVVEFHRIEANKWLPFPVEYKRGKPKADESDKVQLCAQAMCLEEMLNVTIPGGAIFYGKTRRRLDVSFEEELRDETEKAAQEAHELLASGVTPDPAYTKKCERCSLINQCMPKIVQKKPSVRRYLEKAVEDS
jgi:CRISPR-associated exonuclease Cas4